MISVCIMLFQEEMEIRKNSPCIVKTVSMREYPKAQEALILKGEPALWVENVLLRVPGIPFPVLQARVSTDRYASLLEDRTSGWMRKSVL